MSISEINYQRIDKLMSLAVSEDEIAAKNQFMVLETEDHWWQLEERIEAPNLLFRIVRVFVRFKKYFPTQLRWWYLNCVRSVYHQYCIQLLKGIPKDKLGHLISLGMSPDTYHKIKNISEIELHEVKSASETEFYPEMTEEEITKRGDFSLMLDQLRNKYGDLLDDAAKKADDAAKNGDDAAKNADDAAKNGDDAAKNADDAAKNAMKKHCAILMYHPGKLPEDYCDALEHVREVFKMITADHSKNEIRVAINMVIKMTVWGVCEDLGSAKKRLVPLHFGGSNCSYPKLRNKFGRDFEQLVGLKQQEEDSLYARNRRQKTIGSLIENENNAIDSIKKLDPHQMHAYTLLGLICGGAKKPYILWNTKKNDIDLVFHRFKDSLPRKNTDISKEWPGDESKCYILVPALGFPQNGQLISPLLMKVFTWKGIKKRLLYLCERKSSDTARRRALEERLDKMHELFTYELTNEQTELTPRALFFFNHAKDLLYQQLKLQGASDIEIFNGWICGNDDSFREYDKNHEENRKFPYKKNADSLNTPMPKTYQDWPMCLANDEQYSGQGVMSEGIQKLKNERTFRALELQKGAFDKAGWESYKEFCHREKRPVQPYMLSHFLKGPGKRIARQFAFLYPSFSIEVFKEDNKQWLLVTKPKALVRFDDEMASRGSKTFELKIANVSVKNFNPTLVGTPDRSDPVNSRDRAIIHASRLLDVVKGPTRNLIKYVFDRYINTDFGIQSVTEWRVERVVERAFVTTKIDTEHVGIFLYQNVTDEVI